MRCPQCGYLPAKDETQAAKELKQYLLGWPEADRECLLKTLGPKIKALESEHYTQDLLNFLRRLARERMSSEYILDRMFLYTNDPIFMEKLRRADRPWPYIAKSIVSNRRSNV